uniref:Uncharacterized protein n=1 Tax=Trichuris muris TaxID=70415 RepID=A0A5S6Q2X6_TRIMR
MSGLRLFTILVLCSISLTLCHKRTAKRVPKVGYKAYVQAMRRYLKIIVQYFYFLNNKITTISKFDGTYFCKFLTEATGNNSRVR